MSVILCVERCGRTGSPRQGIENWDLVLSWNRGSHAYSSGSPQVSRILSFSLCRSSVTISRLTMQPLDDFAGSHCSNDDRTLRA